MLRFGRMAEEEGLEDGLAAAEAVGSLARLVGEVVAAAAAAGLLFVCGGCGCAIVELVPLWRRCNGAWQERVRRPRRRI